MLATLDSFIYLHIQFPVLAGAEFNCSWRQMNANWLQENWRKKFFLMALFYCIVFKKPLALWEKEITEECLILNSYNRPLMDLSVMLEVNLFDLFLAQDVKGIGRRRVPSMSIKRLLAQQHHPFMPALPVRLKLTRKVKLEAWLHTTHSSISEER